MIVYSNSAPGIRRLERRARAPIWQRNGARRSVSGWHLGREAEHVMNLMLLDGLAPALGGAAAGSLLAIAAAADPLQLVRPQTARPCCVRRRHRAAIRRCGCGVPAAGMARLPPTSSDTSAQRVMSGVTISGEIRALARKLYTQIRVRDHFPILTPSVYALRTWFRVEAGCG